jgi:hypothetical protein
MTLNEVSPPGWGHTKAEKEKTKPNKPKSKIGGSAAAFKRALDDGRFKGLPGSKTKKEKTADMFKLMWSMKKKGDKPHYKPGTDKKYKKYQEETHLDEGSLRKWFKGSKSKDGKGGWVNVVTGGTCASDEPGEGTPKCVSSSKRASMTKAERLSASRRKKAADPGQQSKSGAAKPTYVRTDSKKKMKEETAMQDNNLYGDAYAGLKKKIGSKKKHDKPAVKEGVISTIVKPKKKVEKKPEKAMDAGARARRKVARRVHAKYVSGSENLVPDSIREDKVLKTVAKELDGASKMHKGQANKIRKHLKDMRTEGKKTKNCGCGQDPCITYGKKEKVDEACWKGYKAYGLKKKGGKMVPNCKPIGSVKEALVEPKDGVDSAKEVRKATRKAAFRSFNKEDYYAGTGEKVAARTKKYMDKKGMKGAPGLDAMKARTADHKAKRGVKEDARLAMYQSGMTDASRVKGPVGKAVDKVKSTFKKKKRLDPLDRYRFQSGMTKEEVVVGEGKGYQPEIEHSKMGDAKKKADKKRESSLPPHLQGDAIGKMKKAFATEEDKKGKGSGTKDACYHKVKASAKVWPSAYASGRLVQCRKKGAANYGKSKSEGFEGWADNVILEKSAAWTRKEGKNKEGGLNEKGRKSYEKANPGSDLKAPQPEGGSRKKSFCARMGGMKKKLTSAKTANDPDSRINKALRKWKC